LGTGAIEHSGMLETLFGAWQIPCVACESGEEALALLEARNAPGAEAPFGLVVLDWPAQRVLLVHEPGNIALSG